MDQKLLPGKETGHASFIYGWHRVLNECKPGIYYSRAIVFVRNRKTGERFPIQTDWLSFPITKNGKPLPEPANKNVSLRPGVNPAVQVEGKTKVRMDFILAEPVVGRNVDMKTFTQIKNLLGHKYFSAEREPGTVESVFNRYAHRVSEDKYKRLVELLVSRGYLRIISKPSFTLYDKQSSTITISGDKERAIPDLSMTVQPEVKKDPNIKSREVVLLHTTFISQHSEEFKQNKSIETQNRVTHNATASLIDLNGTTLNNKAKINSNESIFDLFILVLLV